MGGGYWSTSMYDDDAANRRSKGVDDFAYSRSVSSGAVSGVHESLDPTKLTNGIRESRDSDDHPESLPIAVFFDVTGSMLSIPQVMQKKLGLLMDVVLAKAKVKDPQVLVGAIGDAHCDRYPFQVGQFESDNRFDEQLRNIILEGGGGGQDMESYGLAYRFAVYHTSTDSFEKRGKKGYLFTIGDEKPWPSISASEVEKVFGVKPEQSESIEDLIAKVQEKWEVYHVFPLNASHGRNESVKSRWKDLLGERFVQLADESLICETIASLVYAIETARDIDSVMDDVGLSGSARTAVKDALVPVLENHIPAHIAKGTLPDVHSTSSGVTKL